MQITCNTLWWYGAHSQELFFHTPGDLEQRGLIQCYIVGRDIVSNGVIYRADLIVPADIRAISMREARELFPSFPLWQHEPQRERTAYEIAMAAVTAPSLANIAQPIQPKLTSAPFTPTPATKTPRPASDALPYRTGLELTAIYKNWMGQDGYELGTDRAISHFNQYIVKAYKSYLEKLGGDFHGDGHCVEWATPVYEDWRTLRNQWKDFYTWMRNESYYPRHPDTVCGGGHIHVDIPYTNTNKRIQHLCYSYPVLPWIFTQAEDTDSANNPPKLYYSEYFAKLNSSCLSQTKEYAVGRSKWKDGVIEFRFFQAASNWEEQKLHIEFAHAIVSYCINSNDVWRPAKLRSQRQLSAITKQQAVAMFKEFCAIIGFDWRRCQYLFKANLYPRWQRGYVRC